MITKQYKCDNCGKKIGDDEDVWLARPLVTRIARKGLRLARGKGVRIQRERLHLCGKCFTKVRLFLIK